MPNIKIIRLFYFKAILFTEKKRICRQSSKQTYLCMYFNLENQVSLELCSNQSVFWLCGQNSTWKVSLSVCLFLSLARVKIFKQKGSKIIFFFRYSIKKEQNCPKTVDLDKNEFSSSPHLVSFLSFPCGKFNSIDYQFLNPFSAVKV